MLVMLAFSQVGYYFVMHQAQHERKEFVEELLHKTIADDELIIIDFTTNKEKVYWQEEGKEFFFEGDMYDLVKTKNENEKIFFYCINDKKEKELINNYNAETKNNSSKDKKAKNNFDTSSSPLFLLELCDLFLSKSDTTKYPLPISPILSGKADNALKPPQA